MTSRLAPQTEVRASASGRWRLVVFGLVLLGLLVAGFFWPTAAWFEAFRGWVEEQGVLGALVYGLAYVACTVLFVPGSLLTIGAGAIYGPIWGVLIVWIAANVGAAFAFLISRYLARQQVQSWLQGNPRFAAVDAAIAQRGAWIVFLLRLSPVFPFNLLNYALGLTAVRFSACVVASMVGMLPGTIAYVLVGYAGRQSLTGGPRVVYWIVAAAVTLLATYFITRVAARAIRNSSAPPVSGPAHRGLMGSASGR